VWGSEKKSVERRDTWARIQVRGGVIGPIAMKGQGRERCAGGHAIPGADDAGVRRKKKALEFRQPSKFGQGNGASGQGVRREPRAALQMGGIAKWSA